MYLKLLTFDYTGFVFGMVTTILLYSVTLVSHHISVTLVLHPERMNNVFGDP